MTDGGGLCQLRSGVCSWDGDWHGEGSAQLLTEQDRASPVCPSVRGNIYSSFHSFFHSAMSLLSPYYLPATSLIPFHFIFPET